MQELKPCPFCGGVAEMYKGATGSFYGRCADWRHCGTFGPSAVTEEKATERWNYRHNEGRTIVLPAPLGTQIFVPYYDRDVDGAIDENMGIDDQLYLKGYYKWPNGQEYYLTELCDGLKRDEFFLTREAAEAALKKMKDGVCLD